MKMQIDAAAVLREAILSAIADMEGGHDQAAYRTLNAAIVTVDRAHVAEDRSERAATQPAGDWLAIARKHGYAFPDKRMHDFVAELLAAPISEGAAPAGVGDITDPTFRAWCARNGMWAITTERQAFDEAVAIGRTQPEAKAEQVAHARNCSGYDLMQECTCGAAFKQRISELESQLGTEKTMHAAWRKRAEEAEAVTSSEASAELPDATDHYGIDSFYHEPDAPSGSSAELPTDDFIEHEARKYGSFVSGAGSYLKGNYDITKYDCREDFFNCVRACIAADRAACTPAIAGSIGNDAEFRRLLGDLVDACEATQFHPRMRAMFAYLDTIIQGASNGEPTPDDLGPLFRFYNAKSLVELARMQDQHIAKLQAKLPKLVDEFPRTPREG